MQTMQLTNNILRWFVSNADDHFLLTIRMIRMLEISVTERWLSDHVILSPMFLSVESAVREYPRAGIRVLGSKSRREDSGYLPASSRGLVLTFLCEYVPYERVDMGPALTFKGSDISNNCDEDDGHGNNSNKYHNYKY